MSARDDKGGEDVRSGHSAATSTEPITRDQVGCARCDGEGHPGITYQPFTFPIDFGDGSLATHWAPCPTNGEPILYIVVPKEEA